MGRFAAVQSSALGMVLAVSAVLPAVASAASAQEFLNAPVWYLEYEVSFTSRNQGTFQGGWGPMSFTSSLERVFSGWDKLNLRSQGPGPLAMRDLTQGYESGKTPSVAEAQELSMKMLAQMDHTANWMVGGAAMDENATDADIAAQSTPRHPFRIDYKRVDAGTDLVDELGEKFDEKTTTTIQGSGKVLAGGMGAILFEMDTSTNSYALTLPFIFNAQSATAKSESVDILQVKGKPPEETRKTAEVPFDLFPGGLAVDDAPEGSPQTGGVLLRGKLDPSTGKIAGERSFKAHYDDRNVKTPGTMVFKYTLAMTPPKK